jgi:hypothetical protein
MAYDVTTRTKIEETHTIRLSRADVLRLVQADAAPDKRPPNEAIIEVDLSSELYSTPLDDNDEIVLTWTIESVSSS